MNTNFKILEDLLRKYFKNNNLVVKESSVHYPLVTFQDTIQSRYNLHTGYKLVTFMNKYRIKYDWIGALTFQIYGDLNELIGLLRML